MIDRIHLDNINPPPTWKATIFGGLMGITGALRDVAASIDRLSDVVRNKDFS